MAGRVAPAGGAGVRGGLIARLRRVPWSALAPAAFLFLLPIAHTTPARIACLVLSVLTVVAARRERCPAARPPTFLVAAIGTWFGICLLAAWTSSDPAYSWREFRNEVLSTTVAFGVFYFATDDERVLQRWRSVLFASFVPMASIATISYLVGVDWSREGLVGDRNAWSTYVVLVVPFLFRQWVADATPSPTRRLGLALALALALVSGACTQNRNLWFAVAVEAVVFAALLWSRLSPAERRRRRGRAAATALVGVLVFVVALAVVVRQKAVVSRTSTEEQARFDRDPRFEIWTYAAERIRERPWFGHGYGRGILRSDFRRHFDNPLKWHGHNLVVDYALEAGVVGGLAIVFLFGALTWRAVQLYRSAAPTLGLHGVWMLSMLAGIGLKVMTDDILVRETALLFWSVLGMTFGLASRRPTGAARPGFAAPRRARTDRGQTDGRWTNGTPSSAA